MNPHDCATKAVVITDIEAVNSLVPAVLRQYVRQKIAAALRASGAEGRIVWCVTRLPMMQGVEVMGICGWRAASRRLSYKRFRAKQAGL